MTGRLVQWWDQDTGEVVRRQKGRAACPDSKASNKLFGNLYNLVVVLQKFTQQMSATKKSADKAVLHALQQKKAKNKKLRQSGAHVSVDELVLSIDLMF